MKKLIFLTILSLIISSCSHSGIETYYWENGNVFMETNHEKDVRIGKWKIFYPDGSIYYEQVYKNGILSNNSKYLYKTNFYEKHYYIYREINSDMQRDIYKSEIYFNKKHVTDIFYSPSIEIDEFSSRGPGIDSVVIYDSSFVKKHYGYTRQGFKKIKVKIPDHVHIFGFNHYYENDNLQSFCDKIFYGTNYFNPVECQFIKFHHDKKGSLIMKKIKIDSGSIDCESNLQTELSRDLENYIESANRRGKEKEGVENKKYGWKNQHINYSIIHYHPNGKIKELIPLNIMNTSGMGSENFVIDGYLKKFDEKGQIIKKTKYSNGIEFNVSNIIKNNL
jgi:hypothetical protein